MGVSNLTEVSYTLDIHDVKPGIAVIFPFVR